MTDRGRPVPPRPPSWVAPLLRALLGRDAAAELLSDLTTARSRAATPGAGHLWYARQLLQWDMIRLAFLLRARARRAADAGGWARDTRYALRGMRRGMVFPLLCLTVGIGLSAAAFGAVHSVLLAPLPFQDADRLAVVLRQSPEGTSQPITWLELSALRSDPEVMGAEAYTQRSYTLQGVDRSERVAGASVTPGLFPLLGIAPVIGRHFAPDDGTEAGFEGVVLISHRVWTSRFGADPAVIGRTLTLNERPVEVVGVMPQGTRFPSNHDIWLPLGTDVADDRNRAYLVAVARLGAGYGGTAELSSRIGSQLSMAGALPTTDSAPAWSTEPLRQVFTPEAARRFLPVMLAGVFLVLLIACANVANLLLVRFGRRQDEMGLRLALGAGRGQLARMVVIETGLLAAGGALLGVALAKGWLALLSSRLPEGLPYWVDLELPASSVIFVLAVTVLTLAVSAAAPLWATWQASTSPARSATRTMTGSSRLGRTLATAEVALGFLLLTSATLLGRSVVERLAVDPGFDEVGLTAFRVVLSGDAYDVIPARLTFAQSVAARLQTEGSRTSAAWATAVPGVPGGSPRAVSLPSATEVVEAVAVGTSAAYFNVVGLPLLSGRSYTADEAADQDTEVAVINNALAEILWRDTDAVGRSVQIERLGTFTVVGVLGDVAYADPGDPDMPRYQLHLPWARLPSRAMAFVVRDEVRTPGPEVLTAAVADTDPSQAPYDLVSLTERRRLATAHHRLFATLAAEFGAVALFLALAGIYGVVAHEVAGRRREIGIRLALGAPVARVVLQVVRSGALIGIAGVAIGLLATTLASSALRGLLYGIGPTDIGILSATATAMVLTSLLATLVPALRAARHDPAQVLEGD